MRSLKWMTGGYLLTGQNWTVNADDPQVLRAALQILGGLPLPSEEGTAACRASRTSVPALLHLNNQPTNERGRRRAAGVAGVYGYCNQTKRAAGPASRHSACGRPGAVGFGAGDSGSSESTGFFRGCAGQWRPIRRVRTVSPPKLLIFLRLERVRDFHLST